MTYNFVNVNFIVIINVSNFLNAHAYLYYSCCSAKSVNIYGANPYYY